ncbi:MAG: rhomboid family intramembrane serine protease [Anaerolineaceae bacterium]
MNTYNSSEPANGLPPAEVRMNIPTVKPRVTYILMGICIVVYLLQMLSQLALGGDLPLAIGAKINSYILAGQIWRLVTPMFLHGSILHIAFNMYALYAIGLALEQQYGYARYLALFLLSGFAGNVASFLFSPNASVGSSTAIFGLLAAQGVFVWQNRRFFGDRAKSILINTVTIAGINLILGLTPGIDNWGHLGGLVGGVIFAALAGPLWGLQGTFPVFNLVDRRSNVQKWLGGLAVLVIFGGIVVLKFLKA